MRKIFTLIALLILVLGSFSNKIQAQANALKFDPSPTDNSRLNYVKIASPYRGFQKEITVEFWMNLQNVIQPFGSVMGQGGDNQDINTSWLMHPETNGTMGFYVNDGGSFKSVNIALLTGWHHYAGVASASGIWFYVDGVLKATGSGITSTIVSNPNSVIHIGKDVRYATNYAGYNETINRYATMTMDEVRIWSRALCDLEINNNKNCELFNPTGQTRLESYYSFNQGVPGGNNAGVTTLNDQSGNGRNGTLNNFSLSGASSNWVASGSTNNGTCAAFAVGPITGNTSICAGSTTTLSHSISGGSWSSSNPAVAGINASTGAVNALTAGTTAITYNSTCGAATVNFTVKQNPTVTIAAVGGTTACPGNSVTLNATAPAGSTYQWSKDGVAISGASNAGYSATATGSYTAVVVNNGCTSAASNAVGISVTDVTPPTINCPGNQTLNLDASCNAVLPDYRSLVTANDNCTAPGSLAITQSPAAGTTVSTKGAMIVTFTVTDASNNSNTCTITVDKLDVTAPVLTCPGNQTVNNAGNTCGAVVTFTKPTATDNCSGSAFNFFNAGEPNEAGSEDHLQFYNSGTWNDLNGGNALFFLVELNTVTSATFANYTRIGTFGGHTYYKSTFTQTWQNARTSATGIGGDLVSINTLAEDQFLASYGGSVWVGGYQDHADPSYIEPGNAAQNFGGWKWVDGTKLGAGQITITQIGGLASGSVFPIGTTTNTFRATDESGNSSTCSFTVTVIDNQPPVFSSCPGNINVTATGPNGAVVSYTTPVATDNCPGVVTSRTAGSASGSTFPLGTTTVSYTATDAAGLTATCSFTVNVAGLAPVIHCPGTVTVNAATGQCGANVSFVATETTGIPASTITYSIQPGSFFPVGTTSVTATATNVVGSSSCTFNVTVVDAQAPAVLTKNVTVHLDASGHASLTADDVNNGSTDNCGIASMSLSQTGFTCADLPAPVTVNSQTIVSDNSWKESTTSYSTGNYCVTGQWTGVSAAMPALSSYTLAPTINPYSVTPITGTQGMYGLNGVRFFRKTFNLATLDGIRATILTAQDNGVQVFINGVAVAQQGNMSSSGNTFNGQSADRVILNSTGANVNGGVGFRPYDNITNTSAANLFVLGTNEIVLALANCDGTDRGAITFKAIIETNVGGPGNVTLTVTDINGNSASGTARVTVVDAIAPAIQCAGNIELIATSAAGAAVSYPAPVATDNCSVTTAMTAGKASGATFPIGVTTVSFRATDPSGNYADCSFTVTVKGLPPVINCPVNIVVPNAPGQCGANVGFAASETTAIPASVITYSIAPGSFFQKGTTTVVATATNAVGVSTCFFTVTVQDTEAPVPDVVVLPTITGECSASATAPTATDNCAGTITGTTNDPTSYNTQGTYTITWSFDDGNGNISTQTQTVIVRDITAPVADIVTLPVVTAQCSVTVSPVPVGPSAPPAEPSATPAPPAGGAKPPAAAAPPPSSSAEPAPSSAPASAPAPAPSSPVPVTATVNAPTATDNCGGSITGTTNDPLTYNTQGTYVIHWTFTDPNGNVSTQEQTVVIADMTAPVADLNELPVVTGECSATVTTAPTASDNCAGTITGTTSDPLSYNAQGTYTITWTFDDGHGNTTLQTQTVVVKDVTDPLITAPAAINVVNTAGECGTVVDLGLPVVSDNCAVISVTNDAPGYFPVGTTVVTWTVTDAGGNTATATQNVVVRDTEKPVITAPAPVTVNADAGSCAATQVALGAPATGDNCGVASVTNDAPASYPAGTTTVTWTVTDIHGNSSTATQTVTVSDAENPVVITQDITVQLNAGGTATITAAQINNGSADNCGINSYSLDKTSFDCSNVGPNTVKLTVVDIHGNSAAALATVTVKDEVVPVVLTKNITINLGGAGTAAITAVDVNNGSSDACGIASMSVYPSSFSCSNVGNNTVTLTVTDTHGNVSSKTAIVTVRDATPANVVTKNITIYLNASGTASIAASDVNNGSTDACGIASVTVTPNSFNCSNTGNNTVTLTVTDINNNVSSNTATVKVLDTVRPVVITRPYTVTLLPNGTASITPADVNNGSTDNCAIATMTLSKSSFNCTNIGANTVVLTVTDVYGNSSSAPAVVTVVGTIPVVSIASQPTSSVYTGGVNTNLYLGYGAQSTVLQVSAPASGAPYTYSWSSTTLNLLNSASSGAPVFTPVSFGSYTFTVLVTNKYGCTSTASISICVTDIRVPGSNGGGKVYICHLPPGNPGNRQTLSISVNAVAAHLTQHAGDRLGSCDQTPCNTISVNSENIVSSGVTKETSAVTIKAATTEEELKVTVMPNPTTSYFTLKFESRYDIPLNLRVMDASGRVVDARSKVGANSTLQIGHNYSSGTYYAEIIQGGTRKLVQLIKGRG